MRVQACVLNPLLDAARCNSESPAEQPLSTRCNLAKFVRLDFYSQGRRFDPCPAHGDFAGLSSRGATLVSKDGRTNSYLVLYTHAVISLAVKD